MAGAGLLAHTLPPTCVRSRPAPAARPPAGLLAFGPETLKADYRLVPAHGPNLVLGQLDAGDEQVDHVGGQGIRWWVRHASVGLHPVFGAGPELLLPHLQLVAQNVRPQTSPLIAAVHRMRDPGPQNPAIRKIEFVRAMVGAGVTARVTNATPALGQAATFVVLARRLWPGHRAQLTSQSGS